MTKKWLKGVGAVVLLGVSGLTFAGSAPTNLSVTATVTQNCTISTTTGLAFGNYDPVVANATTALNATGSLSIACTQGATGVTVGMGEGGNYSASNRMKGAVHGGYLTYTVYHPPSTTPGVACTFPATTAWTTTGTGLLTLTSPTSKAARTYNVCGTVSAGQDVPVDSYSDTVVATVNF